MTDQHASQQHKNAHDQDDRRSLRHILTRRLTSGPWLARTAGVGLCSVSIGFVLLFVAVLESGGNLTIFTRPPPMQIALVFPSLILTLAIGTMAGALLGWRHRYWSLPVRIHQTVLALLGVEFCWQLSTLGFLVW